MLAQKDPMEPNIDKHYQDMEVYSEVGKRLDIESMYDGSQRILLTMTGSKNQPILLTAGVMGAVLYATAQGFLDIGLKVGNEKVNL